MPGATALRWTFLSARASSTTAPTAAAESLAPTKPLGRLMVS